MEVKERKNKFPKGFFSQPRPEITVKEALEDVIPVEWKKVKKEKTTRTKMLLHKN